MISEKTSHSMFETMYLIREIENLVISGFSAGLFSGTAHTCNGQEAVPVGIAKAFEVAAVKTYVFSNHRGHGHMLAFGVTPERFMFEMSSRLDGQCAGVGGSQHIAYPDIGFMGSNGITGGAVPIAVGHSLGKSLQGEDCVTIVFFGDGATSQGVVHEAMNMASIWELPVLFVCENNMYAMSSPAKKFIGLGSKDDISARAKGYGIPAGVVDGMDAENIFSFVNNFVIDALQYGPFFLQCNTYRYCGHSKSDRQLYRSPEEVAVWKSKDPLKKIESRLNESIVSMCKESVNERLLKIAKEMGLK